MRQVYVLVETVRYVDGRRIENIFGIYTRAKDVINELHRL